MSNPPQPPHDSGSGERHGHCVEGERCVCGGDTPGVRAGCSNWRAALATPSQAVASALQAPDDRLTVAAIAIAAGSKILPLMQAVEAAGEGNVTANQKLTRDQALQAIAAAPAHPVVQPGIQGSELQKAYRALKEGSGHPAGASLLLACDSDESGTAGA